MELVMQRAAQGFVAIDQMGIEVLGKIPFGKEVKITVSNRETRSLAHLRLYWGLIQLVYPSQDKYATAEGLSDAIKIAVGHCDECVGLDGKLFYVPRSISFSAQDQASFSQFFDRAMTVIIEKILPHTNKKDLEREVCNALKISPPEQLMRS